MLVLHCGVHRRDGDVHVHAQIRYRLREQLVVCWGAADYAGQGVLQQSRRLQGPRRGKGQVLCAARPGTLPRGLHGHAGSILERPRAGHRSLHQRGRERRGDVPALPVHDHITKEEVQVCGSRVADRRRLPAIPCSRGLHSVDTHVPGQHPAKVGHHGLCRHQPRRRHQCWIYRPLDWHNRPADSHRPLPAVQVQHGGAVRGGPRVPRLHDGDAAVQRGPGPGLHHECRTARGWLWPSLRPRLRAGLWPGP
mmetsp:Transcript_5451/g.16141  ORF Transcript_5451/g.16141 Transcript_5451/m.16141 type:complete len:251 (+) Transcript_5451:187-939(+)